MNKIVIKKRISLDFLGEDYKEAYLEFKAIPMSKYQDYIERSEVNKDAKTAIPFIIDTLKDLFISGKFPDEKGELFDLTKEDIGELDIEATIRPFKILTGQDQSPN